MLSSFKFDFGRNKKSKIALQKKGALAKYTKEQKFKLSLM